MVKLGSQSAGHGLDQQDPWRGTGTALSELEADTSVASLSHRLTAQGSAEMELLSLQAGMLMETPDEAGQAH